MSFFDIPRLLADSFLEHIEYLPETNSTSDVALQRIAAGDVAVPCLILTDNQTAGRGRGANRWWSTSGGITFSLILKPASMGLSIQQWPRVSLVAALAICETLEEYLGAERTQMKWPNDVFCQGRKISGILVEAPAAQPQSPRHLVVGIGINVNNSWATAPPELQAIGTALCDLTESIHDPTEILLNVLNDFEQLLKQLVNEDARLAQLWQQRSFLTGRQVVVEVGTEEVSGVCQGIDASGALVLNTPTGERSLTGGIVRSFT